ncbi:hypothetical protein PGT21_008967 [Puccinia graminis f. sp. tritici]|uniref:Transcription factor CBF/NF-Y/archaeal histone domain-containing protein n=1 Tax=Puccinia graminis f. sp. tritici TaxID=56615 RepID=A0A5B0M214_PUCGR|nr:hypothetical protein PGT21_008967 [Puccinia graminis f. sp. tritici]KAA1090064.1 hypothetical protein PGTUg99_034943 [Puccinia graminis f. sp. tritici]
MPSPPPQTTTATTTPAATTTSATAAISQFVPRPTTTTQTFLPEFWSHIIRNAEEYQSDFKDGQLPLARIKKLVKSDPDIKMIANEVTVLLDKACEIFVNEITVRAFLVANSLNRRTVNTSDVAMAISQSDMFDFLIDIVPAEQLPSENESAANLPPCPSSSTSPTTAPKNSTTTRKRRTTVPEIPDDTTQTEPTVSTPLPSAPPPLPPKKKPKNHRVNRNLMPEEVAVPIPDTELVKKEPSPELSPPRPPNGRLLAIPIPDSELIPPRQSESTWEMAVPITSNDQQTSHLPSNSGRAWEMAVPISDSSSHPMAGERNWEMAVPISNDLSRPSIHPSHKRKRNWDLAVPIVDEAQEEDSEYPRLEKRPMLKRDSLPSPPGTSRDDHQRTSNHEMVANSQRNWELAVPIVDHQPDPSQQEAQMMSSNPNSRNRSDRLAPVPIDPALFDLGSSVQLTSDLINPHLLPLGDDSPNITIKQEE